jgi:two-component system sensor histidine kinase/response regulator
LQLFRRHALPSIRSKLFTLVLACALPILAGYFAFARDAAERERVHIEQDAQSMAQALVATVDRDLSNGETAARVLANSSILASGDLAQFHAHARRLLRPEFPASAFVLSGPGGEPLLNTRFAYGAPLPAQENAAQIRRVFASGDAVTSGLHRSEAGQPLVVSIDVPVWRDGKVAYVLSVQLRPRRVAELLAGQRLPPHWVAELFDNQQLMVARSADPTRHIGAPMPPALAARVAQAPGGIVELPAAEAEQAFSAFSRSPDHGWTVSVGFPREAARELLGHSQGTLLSSVALLLAISLGFAWMIGGSIARAVGALTAPAAALGRGQPLAIPALPIREAAAVAQALHRVDAELQCYRTQLESRVAERTAELQRSNAQLESVYASAPVGLCFLDRELRVVMINDYLAAINAAPAVAYLGRTLPELMGAAGTGFEQAYRRVLDTGRPLVGIESSGETPAAPGITRHWVASYYPVFGPRRELEGINAVVLDITDRKLEEQRNRDNEELYRALYEGAADAHMLIAYGAGFISGNQAAAQLFGCASVDELLTLSPASASPEFQPDGRRSDSLALEHTRIALERGGNQFEWLHRRPDGSTFHADVVLTSVDIGGKGIIQATVRDISARVASEAALRAASARLEQRGRFIRTVTDHLPALVAYWDAGLRCQFANQPFLDWLGRGADAVIGQPVAALVPPEQFAQVAPHVHGVLEGKRQSFARELQKSSGEMFHAWVNFIPDFDAEGNVRGFYMLHADVTDLKRTQSQLVQALRQAEQASSAKGEFLANMSHEIRTPMNAIMGLARLLEEAPLGGRERGYVARMKLAAKSLLAMLSDVLDYSKVDAGQLALEHTPFRLDEVLDSVAVLAASNAWRKGIEPVFAVAPGVPARLVGDPMRLEQVLLNLVGNAIKFTEQGEVVLSIGAPSRDARTVVLAFAVRDSGIGIAPERHERMFEAFSQGDSSTSRKYGGAGLGLAISRRLVEMMGGELRVTSTLGHGAEFHFEVAFALAEDAAGPALPGPPGALTVLVADDNASACAALAATTSPSSTATCPTSTE